MAVVIGSGAERVACIIVAAQIAAAAPSRVFD